MSIFKSVVVLSLCAYSAHAFTVNGTTKWNYNPVSTDYTNTAGQADWWQLNGTCNGSRQSPININTFVDFNRNAKISLTGSCTSANFYKSDNVKWDIVGGNCAVQRQTDNSVFNLTGIRIHSPAEHQINGNIYDGEIHFVHSNGTYDLVVAIFLDCAGSFENQWLESIMNTQGSANATTVTIPDSYATVVSGSRVFYNYQGSKTSPPCTENVDWWIGARPLRCNNDQLNDLRRGLKMIPNNWYARNARAIQPRNGRSIVRMV